MRKKIIGKKWNGLVNYLLLGLGILILDQVSKTLIRLFLPTNKSTTIIPHTLWLTHVQNTGASFSLFNNHNTILIFVALIVLGMMIYLYDLFKSGVERLCFSLLLAGIIGNLFDRIIFGSVTDFLDLGWWPVFNIADSAMVIGVLLLVGYELFRKRG